MRRRLLLIALLMTAAPPADAFICRLWHLVRPPKPSEPAQIRWGVEAGASVEMEVSQLDKVFPMLTVKSPDGTIREILADIAPKDRPPWLTAEAQPERVQWDSLSFERKKELIELASRGGNREQAYTGKLLRPIPWLRPDGTLRGFVEAIDKAKGQLPEWVTELARSKSVAPDKLRWDGLSPTHQHVLVQHTAKLTGETRPFFGKQERSLPWLTWRDVKVTLSDGKEYSLRSLMDPNIEYGEPGDAAGPGKMRILELHVRGGERDPVEAYRVAQDVQRALGILETPLHLHVVVPMPKKFLAADPEIHGAVVARQWALMNLLVEMESRRAGLPTATQKDVYGNTVYDSLGRESLAQSARWLTGKGKGKGNGFELGKALKKQDIGLRDETTYHREGLGKDVPELMGWEMRFLTPEIAKKFTESVLKRSAQILAERNFAITGEANPGDAIRAWKRAHPQERDLPDALGKAYYHWGNDYHHQPGTLSQASAHWAAPVKELVDEALFQKLQAVAPSNRDVWMLTHDWQRYSDGLLFTATPEQHAKLRTAQLNALRKLKDTPLPESVVERNRLLDRVMLGFQRESGLYDLIKATAGVP